MSVFGWYCLVMVVSLSLLANRLAAEIPISYCSPIHWNAQRLLAVVMFFFFFFFFESSSESLVLFCFLWLFFFSCSLVADRSFTRCVCVLVCCCCSLSLSTRSFLLFAVISSCPVCLPRWCPFRSFFFGVRHRDANFSPYLDLLTYFLLLFPSFLFLASLRAV